MKTWQDLKIGDTLYLHTDSTQDIPNYLSLSDSEREKMRLNHHAHWVGFAIVSDTKQSWILSNGKKFEKKERPIDLPVVLISKEEINDTVFVQDTKRKIAIIIEGFRDAPQNAETLRLILRVLTNMGVDMKFYFKNN
jgi:hypothetical protein